jgi:ketosteroid isomerase-like protein
MDRDQQIRELYAAFNRRDAEALPAAMVDDAIAEMLIEEAPAG